MGFLSSRAAALGGVAIQGHPPKCGACGSWIATPEGARDNGETQSRQDAKPNPAEPEPTKVSFAGLIESKKATPARLCQA
jgi:hypothetical protein